VESPEGRCAERCAGRSGGFDGIVPAPVRRKADSAEVATPQDILLSRNLDISIKLLHIKLFANPNLSYNMPFTASDICKIILAILLPPLGVFLERGCGADLLINILLTILGYIPGIIHALYIILKY
jgi:uncharacterized membrane protein YqaE (UPF0057 family)